MIYIKHSILDPHGVQLQGDVFQECKSLSEAEECMEVFVKACKLLKVYGKWEIIVE